MSNYDPLQPLKDIEKRMAQERIAKLEAENLRLRAERDGWQQDFIEADEHRQEVITENQRLRGALDYLAGILRIAELEVENQRLRAALTNIKTYRVKWHKDGTKGHYCAWRSGIDGVKDIARGALQDGGRGDE